MLFNFLLSISLYWEYYLMGIILLPGIIFGIYAQAKVNNAFNTYSNISNEGGRTASEVAKIILDSAGCNDVHIKKISGELTDNYNHSTKTVSLSNSVYNSTSVSAIGVAVHEVGHVLQYKTNYMPIKLRKFAILASNISSTLLWPLVFIGLIFNFALASSAGNIILWCGIAVFGLAVLVNLVTLPVEYNASHRATTILKQSGLLTHKETEQASKVLNAAALTYVAALVVSILNLLRFLLVFIRRDD